METETALHEILDELVASINKGETAIFCGAGISINSGIPGALSIVEHILSYLCIDEDDKKLFLDKTNESNSLIVPFEMFVDYLESSNSEAIFELFDIFDSSHLEPNENHIFIARLAESGLIKTT